MLKPQTMVFLDELLRRRADIGPCRESIAQASTKLLDCLHAGGVLYACGTGGSAADAEHMVGELMNRYLLRRPIPAEDIEKLRATAGEDAEILAAQLQRAAPAVSLTGQGALATAIANDLSPELIFAQQVYGYGRSADALVAFSTSGNSRNVIHAVHVARAKGMTIIGLTGGSGGRLAPLCDTAICVPANRAFEVQEMHLPIYHTMCAIIEHELFGD